MASWRPPSVRVSRITLRLGSPARTRKIERPPMPSSGLSTRLAVLRRRRPCSAAASRLTSVGGQHCGNSSAASFSLQSRRPCGSLTTSAPARWARPRTWVSWRYSVSTGGSLRISTTCARAAAADCAASPSSNQSPWCRRAPRAARPCAPARPSRTPQSAGQHVVQAMAAALRLEQHREGGVLGDLDRPDRVHHDDDVERHGRGLRQRQWRRMLAGTPPRCPRAAIRVNAFRSGN